MKMEDPNLPSFLGTYLSPSIYIYMNELLCIIYDVHCDL